MAKEFKKAERWIPSGWRDHIMPPPKSVADAYACEDEASSAEKELLSMFLHRLSGFSCDGEQPFDLHGWNEDFDFSNLSSELTSASDYSAVSQVAASLIDIILEFYGPIALRCPASISPKVFMMLTLYGIESAGWPVGGNGLVWCPALREYVDPNDCRMD